LTNQLSHRLIRLAVIVDSRSLLHNLQCFQKSRGPQLLNVTNPQILILALVDLINLKMNENWCCGIIWKISDPISAIPNSFKYKF